MKIELSRVYANKPYYTIKDKNNELSYALGYEQIKKFIEGAVLTGEKVKFAETKFLNEHNKLLDLLNTFKEQKHEKRKK